MQGSPQERRPANGQAPSAGKPSSRRRRWKLAGGFLLLGLISTIALWIATRHQIEVALEGWFGTASRSRLTATVNVPPTIITWSSSIADSSSASAIDTAARGNSGKPTWPVARQVRRDAPVSVAPDPARAKPARPELARTAPTDSVNDSGVGGSAVAPNIGSSAYSTLPGPRSTLHVRASGGGELFLDGQHRGALPFNGELLLRDVEPGSHDLRVVAPGKPEYKQSVTLAARSELTVNIEMLPTEPSTASVPTWHGKTFTFEEWKGTRLLSFAPNQVRYETRDSKGAPSRDSFTASCEDIAKVEPGKFKGAFRLQLKDGTAADFNVSGRQLAEIQDSLSKACSERR